MKIADASTRLHRIDERATLDSVLERSAARPQLVFKHSLTCPISAQAYRELQDHLSAPVEGTDYWLVTVQTERAISDSIEQRLALRHESPQAILVRHGSVVWNASHRSITRDALVGAIAGQDD